jgi:uncharacterized protein YdhG (YjbR/CyaY superfamily)
MNMIKFTSKKKKYICIKSRNIETMNTFNNTNEYIASFPIEVQQQLEQIRNIIRKAAPNAQEVISYGMPAFKQKKILVYFAAFKNHIGLYPTASGIEAFKTEFENLKWSKGAVQFPLNKPLPLDLITKIVKFRVKEDT